MRTISGCMYQNANTLIIKCSLSVVVKSLLITSRYDLRELSDFPHKSAPYRLCAKSLAHCHVDLFARVRSRGRAALMKLTESRRLAPATRMYFNEPLNHGVLSNYARQEVAGAAQGRARMCVIRRNLAVNRYRARPRCKKSGGSAR